jgi:3',5'-cyclic AMP phosphodiesterase CpdA
MQVIQISDTHLSPGKTHFLDNWPPLARWISAQQPDLVIHTGDVTVDGAGVEEDLRHAAGLMRELGFRFAPSLAITMSVTPATGISRSTRSASAAGAAISARTTGLRTPGTGA